MSKFKAIVISILMIIIFSLSVRGPAFADGATISQITITRRLGGSLGTVTVWQGGWVNQTVEFDNGSGPQVTIETTGGTGIIHYQLLNDDGYNDNWDGTATSHGFYPSEPIESNYRAQVDGSWFGGSIENEFYLRAVYPDLIVSVAPTPNASPPFCVGELVDWSTTVQNISDTPSNNTDLGYYIGTNGNDYSNRWQDDSVPDLIGQESYTVHEDYTFQPSDVGQRYMNVWADFEDQALEENEDNNENSSVAFVVNPIPIPDFSGGPALTGEPSLTVNFTNLSSGNPTSYLWSFGDGGTSTETNPSHTYNSVGTFTASLTATNDCGSVTETKTGYVTISYPEVNTDFSATPLSGVAPLLVIFSDLSTGNPTSWNWDFGDGATSTLQNPTYQYPNADTYTVALTATGLGGFDTETKIDYITVTEPAPEAEFSADQTSGTSPLQVIFTDLSTGQITSYAWEFGDGLGTNTQANPTYTYNAAGTYTVELTVTGPGGSDTETKIDYITVIPDVDPIISDVTVSNIRDTAFTVSWITDIAASGQVEYGTTTSLGMSLDDVRGSIHRGETHYVTLSGLTPETTCYFDVVSGSTTDDNQGVHYQITTGPTLGIPASDTAYGQVFRSNGTTIAEHAIVYLDLIDSDNGGSSGTSGKLSALVDDTGYWNVNLGNSRSQDGNDYFVYSANGDSLYLFVEGGSDGIACATVDTANDSPTVDLVLNTCISEPEDFNKTSPSNGVIDQSTSPTLMWEASDGASSYGYCYDTSDDDACSNWISTSTSISVSLSGLSEGETYYWHVLATNSRGTTYSNDSETAFWSFTTGSETNLIFLPLVVNNSPAPGSGFNSQFNGSADDWFSRSGVWFVGSDAIFTPGVADGWVTASHADTFSDLDYEARFWRVGCDNCANALIIRGVPTPLSGNGLWHSYYLFAYTRDGRYSISKQVNGDNIALQELTPTTSIKQGDAWNRLRVVAEGNSLNFYINDMLVWAGTDSSLYSGQVGIGVHRDADSSGNQLQVDWATLTPPGTK